METTQTIGKLTATRRYETGKEQAKKLRAKGLIPAVCYEKGKEGIPLILNPSELIKALDPEKRRNTLFDLTIDDKGKTQQLKVMVKDYQQDPLKNTMLHVDFCQVRMDQQVEISVPLVLEGRAEGAKAGGTLHQIFRDLPVLCKPDMIPVKLTVDISDMEIGDVRRVGDLDLPEGIKILLQDSMTCAQVAAPRAVEEEEEAKEEGEEGEEGEEKKEGEEGEDKKDKKEDKPAAEAGK